MSMMKKAIFAIAALGMSTAPAYAATISSPAVSASADVTSGSVAVTIWGLFSVTCGVTMDGSVTSTTQVTFTSGTSTGTNCNSGPGGAGAVQYPIVANSTSTSVITVDHFHLTTPVGVCEWYDVPLNYNNSTGVATIPSGLADGPCSSISGTLQTGNSQVVLAP